MAKYVVVVEEVVCVDAGSEDEALQIVFDKWVPGCIDADNENTYLEDEFIKLVEGPYGLLNKPKFLGDTYEQARARNKDL